MLKRVFAPFVSFALVITGLIAVAPSAQAIPDPTLQVSSITGPACSEGGYWTAWIGESIGQQVTVAPHYVLNKVKVQLQESVSWVFDTATVTIYPIVDSMTVPNLAAPAATFTTTIDTYDSTNKIVTFTGSLSTGNLTNYLVVFNWPLFKNGYYCVDNQEWDGNQGWHIGPYKMWWNSEFLYYEIFPYVDSMRIALYAVPEVSGPTVIPDPQQEDTIFSGCVDSSGNVTVSGDFPRKVINPLGSKSTHFTNISVTPTGGTETNLAYDAYTDSADGNSVSFNSALATVGALVKLYNGQSDNTGKGPAILQVTLTSCGSGGAASTPTPTPSPSASATPTATPTPAQCVPNTLTFGDIVNASAPKALAINQVADITQRVKYTYVTHNDSYVDEDANVSIDGKFDYLADYLNYTDIGTAAKFSNPIYTSSKTVVLLVDSCRSSISTIDVKKQTSLAPLDVANVNFARGKDRLTLGAADALNQVINLIKLYGFTHVTFEGNADTSNNSGTFDNEALSKRRATEVQNYIAAALNGTEYKYGAPVVSSAGGVTLEYKYNGTTKPLVANDTDAHKELNRRTEIYLSYQK